MISKDRDAWDMRESGPAEADHTVLMLPGGRTRCRSQFQPLRDAMSLTTCSASLPTPGRNPDDIA